MSILHRISRRLRRWMITDIYRKLYQEHAAFNPGDDAVGAGDFDLIGRVELGILQAEGLEPGHTMLDLGCGSGRLAVYAVPYLFQGAYIGVDISQSLLERADKRLADTGRTGKCRVSWLVQASMDLAIPAKSVDRICAFSVFTHLEHEDSYRFLVEARRVIRPGGKMVFSCLPMELPAAKKIFQEQADREFGLRWTHVRNVATSRDLMSMISEQAGWRVVRWYAGDEANIPVDGMGLQALGQSCCIIQAPADVGYI